MPRPGITLGLSLAEELTGDRSVDVVHVCTPNYLHFPQTQSVLQAGKHVICEKPLAMNTGETAALVSLAQKYAKVGAVNYNLRYYPLCQEAHALVQLGAIGEPRLVCGSYLQDWLLYPNDWNWRLEPELGGGLRAVADIGTHWLDLMGWITGRSLTELCADLATVIPVRQRPKGVIETFKQTEGTSTEPVQITTDDYGSILLHFEGGLRGVLTVSQVSAGRRTDCGLRSMARKVRCVGRRATEHTMDRQPEGREPLADQRSFLMSPEARGYAAYPAGHAEGYPDTFVQLFRDRLYIRRRRFQSAAVFPHLLQTGHHEVNCVELIAVSARERRWI